MARREVLTPLIWQLQHVVVGGAFGGCYHDDPLDFLEFCWEGNLTEIAGTGISVVFGFVGVSLASLVMLQVEQLLSLDSQRMASLVSLASMMLQVVQLIGKYKLAL